MCNLVSTLHSPPRNIKSVYKMSTITVVPPIPRYDQTFSVAYSYPANALSGGNYQLKINGQSASSISTITGEYVSSSTITSSHITNAMNANAASLQSMAVSATNPTQVYVSLQGYGLVLYDSSAQTSSLLLSSVQMQTINNVAVAADASYVYLGHSTGTTSGGTYNGCVFRYRLSDASFLSQPFVDLGVATGVVDANKTLCSLALVGTSLYIGGLNSCVYVTNTTNSNPITNTTQFYQGANTTNTQIALDTNYLYYGTLETNILYRVPLTGLTLSNATTLATLPNAPVSLSISGAQLFVADKANIYKISTIDGSFSSVVALPYASGAVMSNTGRLYSITANYSPAAYSLYTYVMNTSVSFASVFYPYYCASFTFSLYNLTKTSTLDIFVVNITCFLEGTKILCREDNSDKYIRVEHLKKGQFIKTINAGYQPLEVVGKSRIYHSPDDKRRTKDRLYVYKKSDNAELTEDLCVTGMHSALVPQLTEVETDAVYETLEDIYLTEGLYRLPACVDKRSEIYGEEGYFDVYHIALSNSDYFGNYGVYANGLIMETTSLRYLKECSQMELTVQ